MQQEDIVIKWAEKVIPQSLGNDEWKDKSVENYKAKT